MFLRQSKIYRYGLCLSWVALSITLSLSVHGQSNSRRLSPTIPRSFERQLIARLNLFTEYQRVGEWDKVALMLIDSVNGEKLTEEQKEHRLALIKARPVISFVPEATVESTANLSRQLNQREWQILGCAEYRDNARTVRFRAMVFAQLRMGQWVFTGFSKSLYPDSQVKLSCTDGEVN